MNTKSKILVIIGALCLILTFLFPLWYIDLEAPQYPEGIGLDIWINKITGHNPHDLANINGLNHYIGMKNHAHLNDIYVIVWVDCRDKWEKISRLHLDFFICCDGCGWYVRFLYVGI